MSEPSFNFKNIWLADDDPDDVEIFEGALFNILPDAQLTVFPSGEELIKNLTKKQLGDLLILDLNMPGADGFHCLKEIRETLQLRRLPVIVYTSSPHDADVIKSYGLGANLYIKKPSSYGDIKATISKVLAMNWNDPHEITSQMFVNGKYIPFKLAV